MKRYLEVVVVVYVDFNRPRYKWSSNLYDLLNAILGFHQRSNKYERRNFLELYLGKLDAQKLFLN